MIDPESAPSPRKPKRKGRKRKISLGAVVLLTGGLVWLNGPGWRWIGEWALQKVLVDTGLTAEFELTGTLLGGIGVKGLTLSGGPIRKLEVGSASARYQISKIIRGELDGVTFDQVSAVIDLDGPPLPSKPDDPTKPEKSLPETLREIRARVLPVELEAADLEFKLVRGAETLIDLGTSTISHAPGSDEITLELGPLAVGPGYSFESQRPVIRWGEEDLSLSRFDLTPRLGVGDVVVRLADDGGISGDGTVFLEDSRLIVSGDLTSARVRMEGEPLLVHEAAKNFTVTLPVQATVEGLEAELTGFDKTPDQWIAKANVTATAIRYEDWLVERATIDLTKDGQTADTTFRVDALEGTVNGSGQLRWRDLASGAWTDFEADAKLGVPQISPVFAALKQRFEFVPMTAPGLPASSLAVEATVDYAPAGIRSARGNWLLSPETDAPSLAGDVNWTPDGPLVGTLGTSGLRATYQLDFAAGLYEATANLDSFRPDSLSPWAAPAAVTLPEGMNASGTWAGSGAFGAEPHRGTFDIASFEWTRPDTPPLLARTKGSYDWPKLVTVEEIEARSDGQIIRASANFADQVLKIPKIEWQEGESTLVTGQAEVPVPETIGSARDFLKQEVPMQVFLETDWVDHTRLAAWLPEQKSPLGTGSGRVRLVVTGTPAEPKVSLEAAVRNLSLPDQPDVPVTDAQINLDGEAGALTLRGDIRPAGYPAVTLSGKTAFKPGLWADDPEVALKESFEASANIPRLELKTFEKFLPVAEELSGSVQGSFSATGTLEKPVLSGELRLSDAALTLKDAPVPPIRRTNAVIRMNGNDVRIQSLALESAGGTLTGTGSVSLEDTANPAFDVSLRGTALPLQRDESMIIRADAALNVRGTLEAAAISGTVDITDSLYYRDFELLPVRVPFTAPSRPSLPSIDPDETAASIPAPFDAWTLNVQVRTRDPLLVRGNLAEGSATANVRFGGTLGNIQPQGRALITDVEASLPFSTLRVTNGAVNFTPSGGLTPELDIRGTSTIGRYEVNIFFYGPVSSPKTAMTSDPPLPESEIMTLLATGTTSDGLEDGQAATLKAAQLIVEEWRRGRLPFAEQVSKVLEVINRVDVRIGEDDPLTGRRLNSATIEVTEKIQVSGSVDKQSNTRVLGAFVLRFK